MAAVTIHSDFGAHCPQWAQENKIRDQTQVPCIGSAQS